DRAVRRGGSLDHGADRPFCDGGAPAVISTAERLIVCRVQSTLAPANSTTFRHFSVSSTLILPKSAGVPPMGIPPISASRALMFGSASASLIVLLSTAMPSGGVPLGAPMPNHALAS